MIRVPKSREQGVGAVQLLEEATALLRRAPLETLACYYLGTLPFMLALLWFWADMSRSADAHQRLAGGALALTLLFVWMKVWQARFASRLMIQLGGRSTQPPLIETILVQGGLQPWGLLVLPLAALITLPFGWCYAFFQNLTVQNGSGHQARVQTARRLALLWPGQNHLLLTLLSLIYLVLLVNLALTAYGVPHLLKSLFGIESIVTRSNLMLLNSTFWAAIAVTTHLGIDPLIKACYVLRCHYGESLSSGADLRAELKELGNRLVLYMVGLPLLALLFSTAQPVSAAAQPTAGQTIQQRAEQLDRSIQQTLTDPRFAWRLPREAGSQAKQELPGFLQSAIDWLQSSMKSIGEHLADMLRWLDKKWPRQKPAKSSVNWDIGFSDVALLILYSLLALLLVVGAVFAWRRLRRMPHQEATIPAQLVTIQPDLNDESVTADELSEDRWAALARELLAKGELRLGLRALYLGSLAALSEAHLLSIARFKTNHDYERELHRFSHALPAVSEAFSLNLRIFEATWYGMHLPDQATVQQFIDNHRRISTDARAQ